jgi:inner membrane protease ATP23
MSSSFPADSDDNSTKMASQSMGSKEPVSKSPFLTPFGEPNWNNRCEKFKTSIIERSETVKFLLEKLDTLGCTVDPFAFMKCNKCDANVSGGFTIPEGKLKDPSLFLCSNVIEDQAHAEIIITHELIHAIDQCRAKTDWTNLRHHACTEIRAANLSGDCRWFQEFQRGNIGYKNQGKRCVRRRAILSIEGNASSRDEAEGVVDEVFNVCYKDSYPFQFVPGRGK